MIGHLTETEFKQAQLYWQDVLSKKANRDEYKLGEQLLATDYLVPLLFSPAFKKEQVAKKRQKSKVKHHRYVVLGVKEPHTEIFDRFHQWVDQLSYFDWLKITPTLSVGKLDARLINKAVENATLNYVMLEFRYYPCNESHSTHCLIEPLWAKTHWEKMINAITR